MGSGGQALDRRIIETGMDLFAAMEGEKPSLFRKRRWVGALMDLSMRDDAFRTQMLRFVDVFPTLHTPALLAGHLREYFADQLDALPAPVRWALGTPLLGRAVGFGIGRLGRQFIVGDTLESVGRGIKRVRREGCAFSLDILGEAVISELEAGEYARRYAVLLDYLEKEQRSWPSLEGGGSGDALDWGYAPRISVSLKPSALYSQTRPQDFEGTVAAILKRVGPIYERVIAAGGNLCIDMESYAYKEITLSVFRALREAYPDYPHLAVALQAYLRETDSDLADLLDWGRARGLTVEIRLVKGAYWDYEVIRARQNGWTCPVYAEKAETDAAFERLTRRILENHDVAYLACSSHNIRSIAAALVMADDMNVPKERYEFQVLYGMAEPIRRALIDRVGRVRLYCPFGSIIPGMAYLVRRLLENTANQGFLRQVFSGRAVDPAHLLRDPAEAPGETEPAIRRARSGAAGLPRTVRLPVLPRIFRLFKTRRLPTLRAGTSGSASAAPLRRSGCAWGRPSPSI